MAAEGWYQDPFGVHGARWFSDGRPTWLVRDGSVESSDRPPDRPWPTPLVEIPQDPALARTRRTSRQRLGLERHTWFWIVYAPMMAVIHWLRVDRHGGGWDIAAAASFTMVSLVFIGRVTLAVSRELRHGHVGTTRAPQP